MASEAFLITNVSLFDGTGGPPRQGSAVLVDGRKVAWVGPADAAPSIEARRVYDAGGATLLPGLINCHVHLCNDGAVDLMSQVINDSVTISSVRGVLNLDATLRSGVTSVRDCGAANGIAIELAKAVDSGLIPGPRIKAAGRVITMTGGHGYMIGREADGPDAVRRATRAEIKEGAHFIKAMATGGVLTKGVDPQQTALRVEELMAVADEAHNAGRRAATHAIGGQGIKNAIRAGIDSIEHGFYLDDEALEMAVHQGTYLVPTLIAVNQIVDHGTEGGIPDWVVLKAESESGHHRESFAAAVRSGMKIACGTDAGTPFNPHADIPLELELMVSFGLSPEQALLTATRNAAENLDLLHSVGTIETGKLADLLVVRGDPLANISAIRDVAFVVKDGDIVRDELSIAPPHA
jgi:imidazolonepropionase-like amidohydrolase